MSSRRHLRAILLNLQDRLTDNDRERLHFYLRDDVPRTIGDDTTLTGNLRLLEKLFDQDKINDENFNLLIDALTQIRCSDAAATLKNYQHRMLSKGQSGSTMTLAAIMPPLATSEEPSVFTKLFDDNDEEDKAPTNHFIVNGINQTMNNGNHNIIDSNNININQTNINSNNHIRSSRNGLFHLSPKASKMLVLIFLVISCVLATLLILMSQGIIGSRRVCPSGKNQCAQSVELLNAAATQNNLTIEELKDQLEKVRKEQTTHLIKAGLRFGGDGGGRFDDSEDLSLTPCHYLSGIVMSENVRDVDAYQFLYKSACENRSEIVSEVHGNEGQAIQSKKEFSLHPDEKISRIEVKVATFTYQIEGTASDTYVTDLVRGIRFFTTKSRSFPPANSLRGETKSESYSGYTLGYATGQCGLAIDQIQFYWYRT